jgi:hypothetical protein
MKKIYHSTFLLFTLLMLGACDGVANERVIVTFLVADQEEYKIQLTEPADIETARKLLAGEESPKNS